MSLVEGEEGSCSARLDCVDVGEEEDSTTEEGRRAVSDVLRIGLEVVEDLLLALGAFEGEALRADDVETES